LRAALAALALTVLAACGAGTRFDRSLSLLDDELGPAAAGSKPLGYLAGSTEVGRRSVDVKKAIRLLDSAARYADTSSDWLRLMARALRVSEAAKDFGIAARMADRARKAKPTYEDIALCACRAYLDAGRPSEALSLFPVPLDPQTHASWYAEAFLAAYRVTGRGTAGAGDAEGLRRVAAATARGEPAVDAALLRLGAGDLNGSAGFLRYAQSLGAAVNPDLAWDAGLPDLLLADPERGDGGQGSMRKADAALLMGERDWAREYLMEVVLTSPDYSWKPYAALAALEGDKSRSDYWYERMAKLFPEDPEAVRARAAYLARTGRSDEALVALAILAPDAEKPADFPGDPRTAVLAGEIQARDEPAELAASRAVHISNDFPDDPYAQRWALGRLAVAERYSQAAEIYRQLAARGVALGTVWYFEALPLILDGKLQEAVQAVERDGPSEAGPDAPFALGVLYARLGDYKMSIERFRLAASSAGDPGEKVRALTEMGKVMAKAGDRKQAREVWAAALSIVPDSAEALRLYGSRSQ
jgi:tetratricopeptide (TPR) repeat protein